MKKWVYLILLTFSFPFLQTAGAQSISNEGTDFWAVFPTHDPSYTAGKNGVPRLANISIIVTSKSASEVTVSCGTFTSPVTPVPANVAVRIDVPRDQAYIDVPASYPTKDTTMLKKAVHVVVSPGKPKVAAYAHIWAGARSAASLLLPVEAMGQKYYSMNYNQDAGGHNFIVIVATEANTDVRIHNADGTVKKTISLRKPGEVFEYMPINHEDLTGTYVDVDPLTSACKKFGMFSGSTSLIIHCGDSRDPLYQQAYPVNSWGKNYAVVPFYNRRCIIRVLAQEDNTTVKFDGNPITLNKGQFYESSVFSGSAFITSDKIISVAQYSLTQSCSSLNGDNIKGDPDMVLLNPVEFNIKQITLFSSDLDSIDVKYVNVCMKTSSSSSFRINGVVPSQKWTVIPSNPLYSYIQMAVTDESLTLTANEGFNAIAYGFGNAESYAYSAGTNLASNSFLLVSNALTNVDNPDACIDEFSNFKIVLPYMASRISWKLDSEIEFVDSAPVPTINTVNGETTYTYIYAKNIQYTVTGEHNMYIVADLPQTVGGCSGVPLEFNFTFKVYALPTPNFKVDPEVCPDTSVPFKDLSLSNAPDRNISNWQWDFGDGTASTDQNPTHTYTASGQYIVKLVVGTESGCKSDVKMDTIMVRPKMRALFMVDLNTCLNNEVTLKDQSTIDAPGKIVKWIWNFGDGKDTIRTDNLPFKHKYTLAGTSKVTLITESDAGCNSLPSPQNVDVHGLPKADFNVPKVCQSDTVAFENTSADADGTIAGLTYSWTFDDASNPNAVNTSVERNATHKYARANDYTVTLTVTNAFGCSSTVTKPFTVNGADPKADFRVENEDHLCSNQNVVVINKSSVDFGEITRLEWSVLNHPEITTQIDLNPTLDKSYELHFDVFDDQPTKTYIIRLIAYSGGSCFQTKEIPITLLASPILKFDNLPDVCINAGKFKLTQASETVGLPGSGVYAGDGVNDDGWFDPEVAGVGRHTITYTYTAANGCPVSAPKDILVMPIPTIRLDRDIYVLAGGQTNINAKTTGSNLTYQWSPSIGLDKTTVANPLVTPEKDMEYTLTVTSDQGCHVSGKVYVHLISSIEAPNAFTPNGDGVNDVWNIKYIDTSPGVTVEIFDRYGTRVFFSKGYSVPFDGIYKNQPLPVGTYYYIITPKAGANKATGSLTLLR